MKTPVTVKCSCPIFNKCNLKVSALNQTLCQQEFAEEPFD